MNSKTFLAFGDELTKIAFFEKVSIGFIQALKEGWHGSPEQIARGEGQSWFGKGPNMRLRPQADGSLKPLSRAGRAWQRISSLGGMTRILPVGGKSMTVLPAVISAPSLLKKEDPSGQQRSRAERVLGFAANTVGGLAGSALAMKAAPGSALLAPMLGGMVAGTAAEKLVTAPLASMRRARQQSHQVAPSQHPVQSVPRPDLAPNPNGVY